jgi:hypothetical protein
MPRGLYSDPYLKALLEKEPKLAEEFLMGIANSEYVKEEEVISCVDVPGWVLEKVGVEACKNLNFPKEKFEEFLKDEELVSKEYWRIFEYPPLSQGQINNLSKSKDVNVRGLALVHPLGDSSALLQYLKKMISEPAEDYQDRNRSTYVIIYICQHVNLNDEIFSYLYSVHDFEGISKTIGQALWVNPTLSDEQKAALVLSDIQPKDESASDYWGDHHIHFISSVPFFRSLGNAFSDYKRKKLAAVPVVNKKVEEFFSKSGHHLSVVLPTNHEVEIEASIEGLAEVISLELLHRVFWTDLCEREDFDIYRRNAYRTDDLFISHPILGLEFEETQADEATKLGGVIYYSDQAWISGEEELSVDRAAALLSSYGEPMVTLLEDGNYESIGQFLIALSYELPESFSKKYGFEVTDGGFNWMIDAALEIAEPDDWDVSADLNPMFGETLSWAKLPDSKKEKLFEFLNLGFNHKESKLRNDSIHFLGCMALHDGTPAVILEKLAKLGDPLIDEVLASRNI